MAHLLFRDLKTVKKLLSEAVRTDARTDPRIVERFVELRAGVEGELGAETHQLLMGRRGTGKSTLLHVLKKRLTDEGVPVATVDMETFNGRVYPDVLIEILVMLLKELRPRLVGRQFVRRVRLRWRSGKTLRELATLLTEPQRLTRKVVLESSRERRGAVGADAGASWKRQGVSANLSAKNGSTRTESAQVEFEELKIERLQMMAPKLKILLSSVVDFSEKRYSLVFLDDFYFVALDEQPAVLGYLHQVCKGTGVCLKIGGVGSRLRPFVDGDPPVGMQPGHDVSRLLLDVTLADFGTAQRFLEEMLEGVLKPVGVGTRQLFADEARNRMVLACGGAVARDYITLTREAIYKAVERISKKAKLADVGEIRVFAVDVQYAIKQQMVLKEQESFGVDAGSDADKLRSRWRDICDFTTATGDVFILVPQSGLDKYDWGNEVQQLENLRLLHRIKDTTAKSKRWTGQKMILFMTDLGQAANQRFQIAIPEFWKSTSEFDKLRRAEWVYTEDWRTRND